MKIKNEDGKIPVPFRELQEGEYLEFRRRAQQRDGGFVWRGEEYRWVGDIIVRTRGDHYSRWVVAEHVDEYFALTFIALFEAETKVPS